MLAVVALECIGDDAAWRKSLRRSVACTDATHFRRAMSSGHLGAMLREEQRYRERPRPWVARITGRDEKYGLAREFIRGARDYADGNSTGSRGVYRWYELPEGEVYEINAPMSWKHADRYFARSHRGQLVRMTREEVDAWVAQKEAP